MQGHCPSPDEEVKPWHVLGAAAGDMPRGNTSCGLTLETCLMFGSVEEHWGGSETPKRLLQSLPSRSDAFIAMTLDHVWSSLLFQPRLTAAFSLF